MFINKTNDGLNNLCGKNVFGFRAALKLSQRQLPDKLKLLGLDVDKNAIQRIEAGKRFVPDIEIVALSKIFEKSIDELLNPIVK